MNRGKTDNESFKIRLILFFASLLIILALSWQKLGFGEIFNPKKAIVDGTVIKVKINSKKVYTYYIYYQDEKWHKARMISSHHILNNELLYYEGDPVAVEYELNDPSKSEIVNFIKLDWEFSTSQSIFKSNYDDFIQGKVESYKEIQFTGGLFKEIVHGLNGEIASESFGKIRSVENGFQIIKYSYPDANAPKINGELSFSYEIDLNSDQDSIWNPKTGEIFIASK